MTIEIDNEHKHTNIYEHMHIYILATHTLSSLS
jgi:hypothetical protein